MPIASRVRTVRTSLRATLRLLFLATAFPTLTSFRAPTDFAAVAGLLGDASAGDSVAIDGVRYAVEPEVASAIRSWPQYYRAGVVGPDAFPDLLSGQTLIHPDLHCLNGTLADGACLSGPSATTSNDWLSYLFAMGASYHANPRDAAERALRQQAIAFVHGYLAHAAGDMWGHTLVNDLAGGVYPLAQELGSAGASDVARRHLVIESYLVQVSPSTERTIAAPTDFLYQAFIANPMARAMDQSSTVARLLQLQRALRAARGGFGDSSWRCAALAWNVGPEACWAARRYIDAWTDAIDDGLHAWPELSETVARRMYEDDDVAGAMDAVRQFATGHAAMLSGPAGSVLGRLDGLLEPVRREVRKATGIDLDPFQHLAEFMVDRAFGFTPADLVKYFAARDLAVDGQLVVPQTTKTRLEGMLGVQGGRLSETGFAPYANTRTTAALALLAPEVLDSLLHGHHVGRLYTGVRLPTPMRGNVMLGFVRSLDGDHQWRHVAPDQRRYGDGMPLWSDCLARRRVFRALFRGSFPDEEACQVLSDSLPTVEVITPQRDLTLQRCFGAPIVSLLISHAGSDIGLAGEQSYSWYVRVTTQHPITVDGVVTIPAGGVVFHRVVHGTIPERGTAAVRTNFSTCRPGAYDVEVRTYQRMRLLDGPVAAPAQACPNCAQRAAQPALQPGREGDRDRVPLPRKNVWIQTHPPFLTAPVDSIQRFQIIVLPPDQCPLTTASAPAATCSGDARASGGTVSVLDANVAVCVANPPAVRPRCDPTRGFPPLDADDDTIPDAGDNCPVDANHDQADDDRDGVGDACELLQLPRRVAADWVRAGVADPRVAAAVTRLQNLVGMDLGPGARPCPLCPGPNPNPVAVALRGEVNRLLIGAASKEEFEQRVRPLLGGVRARISTGDVGRPEVVPDRGRHVRVEVRADGPGVLALEIPAGTFGEPPERLVALRVEVDGRSVPVRGAVDVRRAVITVPVDLSTRLVEVFGAPR